MPLDRDVEFNEWYDRVIRGQAQAADRLRSHIMPTQQVNSSTRSPAAPTMVPFVAGSVQLHFWIHKDMERGLVQLMCKKANDTRAWNECERYAVFTITSAGECYRNSGLPVDWGLRLTKDRRIKEIQ